MLAVNSYVPSPFLMHAARAFNLCIAQWSASRKYARTSPSFRLSSSDESRRDGTKLTLKFTLQRSRTAADAAGPHAIRHFAAIRHERASSATRKCFRRYILSFRILRASAPKANSEMLQPRRTPTAWDESTDITTHRLADQKRSQ